MKNSEDRPYQEIGRRIAEIRKKRGFNQDDLAERAGVAISALKDIERGVSEGYLQTRRAIAEALKCKLADFYREDSSNGTMPDISGALDFLSKYANLPPALQRMVCALVYQDTSFVRGLQLPAEEMVKLRGLLGPLSKAKA